ncbi:type II/IV secretion system ATPase subunit [Candidatus Woesearchaeota archaeon]|nr:type II/IV secretion system ATPase subunit [Candidatus Woesearchaeota archaeon]
MFLSPTKEASYEVINEGDEVIVQINFERSPYSPSIEDDPVCMAKVSEILIEVPKATKVILFQKRDYEYDFYQTKMLSEIAILTNDLLKQKEIFDFKKMPANSTPAINEREAARQYDEVRTILAHHARRDPIGAYVELKRLLRHNRIRLQKAVDENEAKYVQQYLRLITYILNLFDRTKLITLAKPEIPGFKIGSREIYEKLFVPIIKPDFMFTKLMAQFPKDATELESYMFGSNEVTIFEENRTCKYLYHITPPEFKISEEKYDLLDMARNIMAEHNPKKDEFVDPKRMREVFFNVGYDLIEELSNYRNMKLTKKEIDELTDILVRYTVGFGLVESLLQDDKVQDISVNSPYGNTPIFIVHQDYGDCVTNIYPMTKESESWATKLRMLSGRPLDEANQILDTELELPGASVRVSAITKPLDPTGLGFSFRRHRDKPWTIPLFLKFKTLTPLAAGLLSFLIDGTRTFFICGTRSSGKSSLLSGMLIEIMRRYRIITVEDTLELPGKAMNELGYNIQQMRVGSAMSGSSSEMDASGGIRCTLRLGDSSLIVGEVRSKEVIALFEAMRIGAGANVVAGTFHADSAYGVYDRCVNALGIPNTSFKALDICIIANPVKSADGLHKWRRITQITEVRKGWQKDPLLEGGFVDLMKYNAKTDQLEPTPELINGDSDVLKSIAGNIPDFAGDWDMVWNNITLRSNMKEYQIKRAEEEKDADMLEAPFTILCNDMFHKFSGKVKEDTGKIDVDEIYRIWVDWFEHEVRVRRVKRKEEGKKDDKVKF